MKKYVKLTNLVLLIVLVFSGFGIMKVQSSSPRHELKITAEKGNRSALEPVEFYADVSDIDNYSTSSIFAFEKGEGKYIDDMQFPKKLDFNHSLLVDQLMTEYRSFMRGKGRQSNQYIVTDDWLVYTAKSNEVYWKADERNLLTISVLDRETEKEKSFTVTLGDPQYDYDVHMAHFNYPELTIFITTHGASEQPQEQIFTFDIEHPDIGLTEVADLSALAGSDELFRVDQSFDRTNRFVAMQTTKQIETSEYEFVNEVTNYFVYDTKNKEVIEAPLFEEDTLLFTDKEQIYLGKNLEESLELYEMNPDDQKLTTIGTIQMNSPTIGRYPAETYSELFNSRITIFDEKLYAFEQEHADRTSYPVFQITDIQTQETLFLGRVETADSSKIDTTNIRMYEYQLVK